MESDIMKTREENIDFLVRLTNENKYLKQYNRFINNRLFPEEDFDVVYYDLMKRLIALEEYEKCAEILKIKKLNDGDI